MSDIRDASAGSASRETPRTENEEPCTYERVKTIAALRVEIAELKHELAGERCIIDRLLDLIEELESDEQE